MRRSCGWWSASSVAVAGAASALALPFVALIALLATEWCKGQGWPMLIAVPLTVGAVVGIGWWWLDPRRQERFLREVLNATPFSGPEAELTRRALNEVKARSGFRRRL